MGHVVDEDDADRAARAAFIGMLVRERKARMSMAEVVRRSGLAKTSVQRIEYPDADPFVSTVQRYARGLGHVVGMDVGEGP